MKPPLPSSSSTVLRKARLSPYLFTLLAFIVFVAILYGEDFMCIFGQLEPIPGRAISRPGELTLLTHSVNLLSLFFWFDWVFGGFGGLVLVKNREKLPFAIGKTDETCDIFSGRWVKDELTRPLYEESECPYIQPQLTCQEHGRLDTEYQKWRWQPHGCDLPR